MKREIALRLAEALRSGKYVQSKKRLSDPDEESAYCCLGVLCELAVEDGVIERRDVDMRGTFYGTPDEFINEAATWAMLPDSIVDYAGLTTDDGIYLANTIYFDVTGHPKLSLEGEKWIFSADQLNDYRNFTFDEIAELLEQGKYVTNIDEIKEFELF